MPSDTIRLYQSTSSPNSRRVRIFLAEKGLSIPLVAVDPDKGEQHSEADRASVSAGANRPKHDPKRQYWRRLRVDNADVGSRATASSRRREGSHA
jgi:hypothetical protein